MSKPVLVYFNGRGRAEISRFILAEAGIEYEDKRVSGEEFAALKPSTPFGQLPILEHDGLKLSQSHAIARYLARLAGLYGKDIKQDALIDMFDDSVTDAFTPFFLTKNDEEKKKYFEETMPKWHQKFEEFLTKNGTGFFVGNNLSLADIAVFHFLDYFGEAHKTSSSVLAEFQKRIASRPNIAAWLAKRPQTVF